VANQPRAYCPKCGAAARRLYFQMPTERASAGQGLVLRRHRVGDAGLNKKTRVGLIAGVALLLLLLLAAKPLYDQILLEGEPRASHRHGRHMLIELLREGPDFELKLDSADVDSQLPYLRPALANITRERGVSFNDDQSLEIMNYLQGVAGPNKEWRFFELDGRHFSVDF
jgi:hypothetical protein